MLHITPTQLNTLINDHPAPCVSLYQSTQRSHPENHQGPILFKNQLKEIRASLALKYKPEEIEALLAKFDALTHDMPFWNHRTNGVAIFGSQSIFEVFDLHQQVKDLVVVADNFHVKPLFQVMQTGGRYHVLALNRQEAKLYIGDRDMLRQVPIVHMPSTLTEALGDDVTESRTAVHSTGAGGGRANTAAMHHGSGQKKDEVEIDLVKFFRVIDRGVHEHYTRPSGLPLMLAALGEYHTPFHEISHNPNLMKDGIHLNPDSLTNDQLREHAWKIAEPQYMARLATLTDNYQLAKSKELGSDNLSQIAKAALEGRVATLLIEADRQIGGKIDRTTGRIKAEDLAKPDVDDLLDDLAVMVMRTKGEVLVMPKAQMPSETGAAATYRF